MEIKEESTETVVVKRVTGWRCDNCGLEAAHGCSDQPEGWHKFYHQHHSWGDESCQSVVWHDVCSATCYLAKLKSLIAKDGDRYGFEVDGMTVSFAKKLATVEEWNI